MSTPKAVLSARDEVRQVSVTKEEIGCPCAMTAGRVARQVFEEARS